MRDGSRRIPGICFAALLWVTGLAAAHGQQYSIPNAGIPGSPSEAPPSAGFGSPALSLEDQFAQLRQQLQAQQAQIQANEAELRALRAQQQQQSPAGVVASPAAFDASHANAEAAAGPAANAFCTPKEVPIIDKPTFAVHGQIFMDNVSFSQSDRNIAATGKPREQEYTGFSVLRLSSTGWLYENVDYVFMVDFATGLNNVVTSSGNLGTTPTLPSETVSPITQVNYKDIYATVHYLPFLGNVQAGFFKEPFLFDELQPDIATSQTFIRRSLVDAFAPSRRWGIMAFDDINENKDLTWFAGTFRDGYTGVIPFERSNEGDWDISTRIVWLPYYDEASDGRYLIHTGFDFIHSGTNGTFGAADTKAFSIGPEAQTLYPWVNTGNISANSLDEFNVELAIVDGPLSAAAEVTYVDVNRTVGPAANFSGAYVQVGYFLTGESHGYDRVNKRWGRTKPFEPFFRVRTEDGVCWGKGAWEVAARYSYIDLNSGATQGGRMDDTTLALSWYLNAFSRLEFNYIHSTLDRGGIEDAPADIYEMRFWWDF
jgi:phosphate-selective porin OprO/OprP